MRFTDELWQQIAPVYEAIISHPFLRELTDGTLARASFVFYMKQDALYLQDFSRALALAGVRSPSIPEMQRFFAFASGVVVVERALHESYFKEFGVILDVDKAPACFAYAHFLLSTASTRSYPESLAALLPCFWIYREVGNSIYHRAEGGLATNPYARWIETYAGDEFNEHVNEAIEIVESVARDASEGDRAGMRRAFESS